MSDVIDRLKKVQAFGPETESTRNDAIAVIERLRAIPCVIEHAKITRTAFLDAAKMAEKRAKQIRARTNFGVCGAAAAQEAEDFAAELRRAAEGVKDAE